MSLRYVSALVACWILMPPPAALGQDPRTGRATIGGVEATFGPPLVLWEPDDNHVAFAFFSTPPGPDAEVRARETGEWRLDLVNPSVVLEMDFTAGAVSVLANTVESCRVRARGFGKPLDLEGQAEDCHVTSVGGLLRPGAGVMGVIMGTGDGYSLHLPFSLTLPEAGAETAAATEPPPVPSAPPLPPNTVEGKAAFDQQQLTLTHGLAWWRADRGEVRVALFDREPPPGILADLRAGSWGEGGPVVSLHLEVTGQPPVSPSSMGSCFLNATFPRGGPMGTNTDAKGCGVAALGGEMAPAGHVTASLKGEASGPGGKPYSWELRFNLPIAP